MGSAERTSAIDVPAETAARSDFRSAKSFERDSVFQAPTSHDVRRFVQALQPLDPAEPGPSREPSLLNVEADGVGSGRGPRDEVVRKGHVMLAVIHATVGAPGRIAVCEPKCRAPSGVGLFGMKDDQPNQVHVPRAGMMYGAKVCDDLAH